MKKVLITMFVGAFIVNLSMKLLHVEINAGFVSFVLFISIVEMYGVALWWSVKK